LAKTSHIHDGLINACVKGDHKAQMKIYELYSRAMLLTAMQMIKDPIEAEEAVQESFLRAFSKLGQFEGKSTFGAWLKRIVVHECWSRNQKQGVFFDELEEVEDQHEEKENDDIELTLEKVKKCMALLPDGYRLVLSMYLLEGYDHEEIAEVTGISAATSRSQFLRGKKKLLEMLKEESHGR
tara:strand:+ start:207 stop:752 length:546 start_codon:yes stop_codon:yes gene_type:complete